MVSLFSHSKITKVTPVFEKPTNIAGSLVNSIG